MSKLINKTDRCMYRQWDYDYNAFGAAIRLSRRSRDLTQDEVAQTIGCARSTIWKMENGGYCSPLIMFKISEFLGVDFMQFNVRPESEEQMIRGEM